MRAARNGAHISKYLAQAIEMREVIIHEDQQAAILRVAWPKDLAASVATAERRLRLQTELEALGYEVQLENVQTSKKARLLKKPQ